MTLPSMMNWDQTRAALHQVAQVIGAVRVACSDPLPNDLHYSLNWTTTGFSSATMRCGGVLEFNLRTLQLAFTRCDKAVFTLTVRGHSQISLANRLLATFADCGYSITPSMQRITNDSPFEIDPAMAEDSLAALNAMYTALARFRAKLVGYLTPLVLWPHHFDLAFLCFPTSETDEHSAPQMAFGFATHSAGLDRPYLYAYAWSKPTGYLELPVAPPAQALTEDYTGLYLAYDGIRSADDLNSLVESLLLRYHRAAGEWLTQP